MSKLYVYPKLGKIELFGRRLGGRGLGNILFTFARALVLSKKFDLEFIYPTWNSIKIGPLLRGEKDARSYNDLFDKPFGISGLKKTFLMLVSKKYSESDLNFAIADRKQYKILNRPAIIECYGHEGFFESLIGYRDEIRSAIIKMMTDNNIKIINKHDFSDGIVVHIRMGDFQPVPSDLSKIEPWLNYRLPLNWYSNIIDKIRLAVPSKTPVYVFSDGTSSELSEILSKDNTFRIETGSSITDIIALSSGSILIGSGSSFSMWAAFLGGMPSVWFPKLHSSILMEDPNIFEGEIGFEDPLPRKLLFNLESLFPND